MEESSKKNLIQGVIFIVVFVVAFFATKYVISCMISAEDVVKEISEKINKKCPLMLNSELRLDNTDFNPFQGKAGLVYVCTLINEDKNSEKINFLSLDKKTKLAAQKEYNSNPELEYLRDNDLIIYYVCYDKNKASLFGYEITNQKR